MLDNTATGNWLRDTMRDAARYRLQHLRRQRRRAAGYIEQLRGTEHEAATKRFLREIDINIAKVFLLADLKRRRRS